MIDIVSSCVPYRNFVLKTIFDFKKGHDLEIGVKGHSRSLKVAQFERLVMLSY